MKTVWAGNKKLQKGYVTVMSMIKKFFRNEQYLNSQQGLVSIEPEQEQVVSKDSAGVVSTSTLKFW